MVAKAVGKVKVVVKANKEVSYENFRQRRFAVHSTAYGNLISSYSGKSKRTLS